jgi:hypothetical protein
MPYFKIYHGLGGGFGGAHYDYTDEFPSRAEAEQTAYQEAIEDYQSYEGRNGILDYDECYQARLDDFIDEYGEDLSNDDYDEIADLADDDYQQEIEGWIDYYVVEATGP